MTDAASPPAPAPLTGPAPAIDSRAGWIAAVGWGFREAVAQDARRIFCVDNDFAEWPWDDAPTLDALAAWLRQPQRRLTLLARRFDDLPRRFPRFNGWRREWSHAISAWQPPDDWPVELPSLLVSDRRVSVHLIDAVHWRGRAQLDGRAARQWCEKVDVVLQRSEATYATSTLGL